MRCDRSAKDQPPEITMFRISEVQESPVFNGRRSFLTLRRQTEASAQQVERAVADKAVTVQVRAFVHGFHFETTAAT